jgi:hypothetical protein
MIDPSDSGAVALPCPRWCAAGDCQWAPDGEEWAPPDLYAMTPREIANSIILGRLREAC